MSELGREDYIQKIWSEGKPITDTPAQQYLEQRGIRGLQSDGLRFHSGLWIKEDQRRRPALLVAGTTPAGVVGCLQRIWLPEEGQKATKKSIGKMDGCTALIKPGSGAIHILVDGPEDACSIAMVADSAAVSATFGKHNFARCGLTAEEKHIILVADNDKGKVSKLYRKQISELLKAGKVVEFCQIDGTCGDDANDIYRDHGAKKLKEVLKARKQINDENFDVFFPPEAEPDPKKPAEAPLEPSAGPADVSEYPFKVLGHNNGKYFFLSQGTQQLAELTPSKMNKQHLLALAPLTFWERVFAGSNKGVNWDMATNALMRMADDQGIFDPGNGIRGLGAWLDGDSKIIHLGSQVLRDGEAFKPFELVSDEGFVYPKQRNLKIEIRDPLTDEQAAKFPDICEGFSWRDPAYGRLLAGWCVIAMVGGMLDWRPHIWITGEASSGKSTLMNLVIKKILVGLHYPFEGGTSEAGIRQRLQSDALAVVMDEAEGEDQKGQALIQGVLSLMRKSSSGAEVVKGTASHEGKVFVLRSCFCLLSVNTSATHEADQMRITKLHLVSVNSDENDPEAAAIRAEDFKSLKRDAVQLLTPEYAEGMFARVVANIDTLRANIATIKDAAEIELSSPRLADQVAPLLAGYQLCRNAVKITQAEAECLLQGMDREEPAEKLAGQGQRQLFDLIFGYRLTIEQDHDRVTKTVGEWIKAVVAKDREGSKFAATVIDQELRRYGIRVEETDRRVVIANDHKPILDMLSGSVFGRSYKDALKRLPGATSAGRAVHFVTGVSKWATYLPLSLFEEE